MPCPATRAGTCDHCVSWWGREPQLRGLLLKAYAFSTIGTVMLWGAIASFVLAAVMAVLVGLGFWHARRTPHEEVLLARQPAPVSS